MADGIMTGMVPAVFADVPRSVSFKKLRKRIVHYALLAIGQFACGALIWRVPPPLAESAQKADAAAR